MFNNRVENALHLLRSEFLEFPDLRLTAEEISELFDLDKILAEALLDALVYSRFLERRPEAQYALRTGH